MQFDGMIEPGVREWCEPWVPGADSSFFIDLEVHHAGILSVAATVLPAMVEIGDSLFVRDRLDDSEPRLHEALINRFSVWDDLTSTTQRTRESDRMVAEFVARGWRLQAARRFPAHPVLVEIVDDPGPTVIMTTARDAPGEPVRPLPPIERKDMPDHTHDEFHPEAAPHYRAWRDAQTPPGVPRSHLAEVVGMSGMAAVAGEVFPTLVDVDHHVLLESHYSRPNLTSWQMATGDDPIAIESIINRYVIWNALLNSPRDDEDLPDEMVVEFVATCWQHWFHDQFPERTFEVAIYDGYGPTVGVYEIRP